MKKITKLLLPLVALTCINVVACGNTTTTTPTTTPEIVIPEIQYTLEEEIVAGVTANDKKYSAANVTQRAHQILQCLWIHASLCLIATVGMSANVRRNLRHLHFENAVVSIHCILKSMLPM